MSPLAALMIFLSLTVGFTQTRPDFSGTWARTPAVAGEPVEILTITQTRDTLTVDDAGHRWVHTLDGSESKRATTADNPEESVQLATSSWEGDTLVTVFPIQSGPEGPYLLRVAVSLDGKTLVVHATSTSQTTNAVFRQETKRYSQ